MRLRSSRALPALALVLGLSALSGCGDDDSATPDASGAGSEATDPAAAADVCTSITEDQVAQLVGGPVAVTEVPGGGCSFSQDDPRAASVSFATTPLDESTGGLDGTRAGVTGVIAGDAEDLDLGDGAFVVVGTSFGGDNQQGGGAVAIGGSVVQVNVIQGVGLSTEEVHDLTVGALELAVEPS